MNSKSLKYSIYIVIIILILIFYTKDIDIFNNTKLIDNPSDLLVLVNKNNKLDENYIPNDLEIINNNYSLNDKYLRSEARINFEKLSNDASKEGLKIIAVSTYRSYEYQDKLYNDYVKEKGLQYASMCSAEAGHSEHQTGLAVDVMGSNNDYDKFESSIEFSWMNKNAHKYGFILRYPKDKEYITGFKYEPWHYRYVGVDVATYIYENNLTFEEYNINN